MVGGEFLGRALATTIGSHAGMNVTGYNTASVHPNNMPNNDLAFQQLQGHVTNEGLWEFEAILNKVSGVVSGMTGISGGLPVIPGPPVNDPEHGVTIETSPGIAGIPSKFPDAIKYHINATGAQPSATQSYYEQKNKVINMNNHK